jgi:5-methylcytosine-specific restriction endonuclease McrA
MTSPNATTRRWRKLRARQLKREPWSRLCPLGGERTKAVEVDDIIPLSKGGAPYDLANLRSVCEPRQVVRHGGASRCHTL